MDIFLIQFHFFQNSYSDSEDNNAMNCVTVEGIDIKNEDFDSVDNSNSIYEEEISADTLDSKPLKDQDKFENSENESFKIQEKKPKVSWLLSVWRKI